MKPVCGTTACWAGLRYQEAVARLLEGTAEAALGVLQSREIQLCPQNFGVLDERELDELQALAPSARFRMHASVRVFSRHATFDASSSGADSEQYFARVAELSRHLGAPAYTLHAGERSRATRETIRSNVLRLQDRFGIPVGVEALYPAPGDRWLLSSWADYEWLLASELHYAIDLSHLAIVARHERRAALELASALVSNARVLEVHVSDNDGRADRHTTLARQPWWWPVLEDVHPDAVIFSEGNQNAGRRPATGANHVRQSRQPADPPLLGHRR